MAEGSNLLFGNELVRRMRDGVKKDGGGWMGGCGDAQMLVNYAFPREARLQLCLLSSTKWYYGICKAR